MGSITPEDINVASMLIQLGLTTVVAIRNLFSSQASDDTTLDAIMSEVDARIARRSQPK